MSSNFIESKSYIESYNSNEYDSLQKNERFPIKKPKLSLNYRFGEAKRCLETLIRKSNMNTVCDQIKRKLDIGQSLK